MADDKMMAMFQPNKTFTQEFRGVRYDYYLTGIIGAAEDYLDLCNILRSATAQDEVIIRINSNGGSVATGNMIINAISESEANVIGFIESDCGSMATFIFLACHTWGVSESAEFFSHTCSYGAWGKEHENFTQAEFIRKQSHKQMRARYANFLTSEEIEKVISGSDVYLNADEIMERLETYADAREAKGCGNSDCTECGVSGDEDELPTLKDMIKEAVDEVLTERDKKAKLAEKKAVKQPTPKLKKALEQSEAIKIKQEEWEEQFK